MAHCRLWLQQRCRATASLAARAHGWVQQCWRAQASLCARRVWTRWRSRNRRCEASGSLCVLNFLEWLCFCLSFGGKDYLLENWLAGTRGMLGGGAAALPHIFRRCISKDVFERLARVLCRLRHSTGRSSGALPDCRGSLVSLLGRQLLVQSCVGCAMRRTLCYKANKAY